MNSILNRPGPVGLAPTQRCAKGLQEAEGAIGHRKLDRLSCKLSFIAMDVLSGLCVWRHQRSPSVQTSFPPAPNGRDFLMLAGLRPSFPL